MPNDYDCKDPTVSGILLSLITEYNMERKVANAKTQLTLVKYLLFSYDRKKTNVKCQIKKNLNSFLWAMYMIQI